MVVCSPATSHQPSSSTTAIDRRRHPSPPIHATLRIHRNSAFSNEQNNYFLNSNLTAPKLLHFTETKIFTKLSLNNHCDTFQQQQQQQQQHSVRSERFASQFTGTNSAEGSNIKGERRSLKHYERSLHSAKRTMIDNSRTANANDDDARPTSSSTYPEDYPSGTGIDKIPPGAVRQKLKIFDSGCNNDDSAESVRQNYATVPREAFNVILSNKQTSLFDGVKTSKLDESEDTSTARRTNLPESSSSLKQATCSSLPNSYILLRKSQQKLKNSTKNTPTSLDLNLRSQDSINLQMHSLPLNISIGTLLLGIHNFSNFATKSLNGRQTWQKSTNETDEILELNNIGYNGESLGKKTVIMIDGGRSKNYHRAEMSKVQSSNDDQTDSKKKYNRSPTWNDSIKNESVYTQPSNDNQNVHTVQIPVISTNPRILIAQLASVKDLNHQLALKLAKAERDIQTYQVQLELMGKDNEAKVASKVADVVANIKLRNCDPELLKKFPFTNPIAKNTGNNRIRQQTLENLLKELEGKGPKPLSPETVRKNCSKIMEFVQKFGCSIKSDSNTEAPVEEKRSLVDHCQAEYKQKKPQNCDNSDYCNKQTKSLESNMNDAVEPTVNCSKQIHSLSSKVSLLQCELSTKEKEIERLENEIAQARRCSRNARCLPVLLVKMRRKKGGGNMCVCVCVLCIGDIRRRRKVIWLAVKEKLNGLHSDELRLPANAAAELRDGQKMCCAVCVCSRREIEGKNSSKTIINKTDFAAVAVAVAVAAGATGGGYLYSGDVVCRCC
uniref:Protein kinase domain-containing protein n=1 Tax=Syphacia muris TaxID=451379 RepID=A0A158R4V9_9BILA